MTHSAFIPEHGVDAATDANKISTHTIFFVPHILHLNGADKESAGCIGNLLAQFFFIETFFAQLFLLQLNYEKMVDAKKQTMVGVNVDGVNFKQSMVSFRLTTALPH